MTLLELLLAITLLAVLAFLAFVGTQAAIAAARRAGCVSNLRQIGAFIGMYAGDHNGNWPCYIQPNNKLSTPDNSTYSDSRNRLNGEVISALGAIAPYTKSNKIFFCPADKAFYKSYKDRNFETEDAYGSYVTRGRNTIGSTLNPLGRKLADVAGYSIVSCYFLGIPNNPNHPISHHTDQWPVLFGDGHVTVAKKPDWLDIHNFQKVNDTTPNQIKFWRYFDTQR